jgi:uncharacterized Zn-finger protein
MKDHDFSIANVNTRRRPRRKTPPKHLATAKFTCDYCKHTFKAKQGLTRHVQSHIQKSVPWMCDQNFCNFATSSKIKLNQHRLQSHNISSTTIRTENGFEKKNRVNGVKVTNRGPDYACFCGATFGTMFSLRAHKK